MINDSIADLLIRIKNGYLAKKDKIKVPYSKSKHELVKLLLKKGYIAQVTLEGEKIKKQLVLTLKYSENKAAISGLEKVSKSSLRVYVDRKSIPRVLGGLGITIISTSQGIMSGYEAKKKKIGGELICKIW